MSNNHEIITVLHDALASSPDKAPLRKYLADLLLADGKFKEAEKEYREVLSYTPDDDEVKFALATAFYHQEKGMVALVILERLMKGANPPAPVFLLSARSYLQSNQRERAVKAYQQALRKDPALADAELESKLELDDTMHYQEEDSPDVLVPVPVEDVPLPLNVALERSKISFKDVGGMEKLKEEVRMKIIHPLNHPEIYQAYGKSIGGGILMYGPPGCGKTYLARATAGEVKAYFLAIGIHDVLNMYLGQSEHNLHQLFEFARSHTPCVLFIDEVDALGANRSDMRRSAGRQLINQFLSELDGVNTSNEGVLILAATNAPWHLEPALRRPGRFDRVLFVPPPDQQARAAILQIMLADKPTQKIDYQQLAKKSVGFSGADLKGAVDIAVENKLREAMKKGLPTPLTTKDLLVAVKSIKYTTRDWFSTARNYALYSNQSGIYDDILEYMKLDKNTNLFSRLAFWKDT